MIETNCIHIRQGLELDYIRVFIGVDLIFIDGKIDTDVSSWLKGDVTVKGGLKKLIKENEIKHIVIADGIIKYSFRTLKGSESKVCLIYCVNQKLMNLLKFYDINGVYPIF